MRWVGLDRNYKKKTQKDIKKNNELLVSKSGKK